MKFHIILILATFLQCSYQSFNPFQIFSTTTRYPRTTTPATTTSPNARNHFNNRNRTWSLCTGDPPMRFTTDNYDLRIENCTTGQIIASAFMESFFSPIEEQTSNTFSSGGIQNLFSFFSSSSIGRTTPSTTCTNDPTSIGGSLGNCNGPIRTKRNSPRNAQMPTELYRDIMILLDESGSIDQAEFEMLKRTAAAIVKLLCDDHAVHPDMTRIGVTSFDSEVHPHIKLLETDPLTFLNYNANLLAEVIESIRISRTSRKGTCLYDALQYTHNRSFSISNGGRRNDLNIVQEIILLTDGCAGCRGNLTQMRETLIRAGTSVYVIGVGLSHTCQNKIKILAQGGRCNHFFFMDLWGVQFHDFIQSIVQQSELASDERSWCIRQLHDNNRNC